MCETKKPLRQCRVCVKTADEVFLETPFPVPHEDPIDSLHASLRPQNSFFTQACTCREPQSVSNFHAFTNFYIQYLLCIGTNQKGTIHPELESVELLSVQPRRFLTVLPGDGGFSFSNLCETSIKAVVVVYRGLHRLYLSK